MPSPVSNSRSLEAVESEAVRWREGGRGQRQQNSAAAVTEPEYYMDLADSELVGLRLRSSKEFE